MVKEIIIEVLLVIIYVIDPRILRVPRSLTIHQEHPHLRHPSPCLTLVLLVPCMPVLTRSSTRLLLGLLEMSTLLSPPTPRRADRYVRVLE